MSAPVMEHAGFLAGGPICAPRVSLLLSELRALGLDDWGLLCWIHRPMEAAVWGYPPSEQRPDVVRATLRAYGLSYKHVHGSSFGVKEVIIYRAGAEEETTGYSSPKGRELVEVDTVRKALGSHQEEESVRRALDAAERRTWPRTPPFLPIPR